MGSRKRSSLPFDKRGGAIVIQRALLESQAYHGLSHTARALLPLLQCHWRNDKAVDYGVREAAASLRCNKRTAMHAFDELQQGGFISVHADSNFDTYSGRGSRPRAWRLTWLPFNGRYPTNEWDKN